VITPQESPWIKVLVLNIVDPGKPRHDPYIVTKDARENPDDPYEGSITVKLSAWPRSDPPKKGTEFVEVSELSQTTEGWRANHIRPIETPRSTDGITNGDDN